MSVTLTPETTAALCVSIFDGGEESRIIDINVITSDALIMGLDAYARDVNDADNVIVAAIKAEAYPKVARLINEDKADHTDPVSGLRYERTAAYGIAPHITVAAFKLGLPRANG